MFKNKEPKWATKDLTQAIDKTLKKFFINNKPYSSKTNKFLELIVDTIKANHTHEKYLHQTPVIAMWRIISNCNLRCEHCYFHGQPERYDSKNDLNTEQIFEIIDILGDEFNLVKLTLTGGEIFLREDIFEIIKYIKSKNISLTLHTNGILLNPSKISKLSKILNLDTDIIQVSLDGASSQSHAKTRGKDIFDLSCNSIKNLIKNKILTSVNCTATSINIYELPDLYKLCTKMKVIKFSLSKIKVFNPSQSHLLPNINLLYKAIAEITTLSEKSKTPVFELTAFKFTEILNHKIANQFIDKYVETSTKICNKDELICHNHNKFLINPDGKVYLCFSADNEKFLLGDTQKETLTNIWNNRHQNALFKPRILEEMVCKECKYFSLCKGGCPALAYYRYNNVNTPDSRCEYGKSLMEKALPSR